MNNKKTIIILILVLTMGIVGLTVAYFANSASLDNVFETKPYGNTFTEEFVSPDNWLPGTTTEKSVVATNTGEVDQAVRIKLTENWKTANNGTLNGWIHIDGTKSTHESANDIANDERVAIINFDNNDDWYLEDGYYYYKYKLAPNESTSSLIKSVTFNSKTKLDDTCVTTTNGSTKTVICNSSDNDYDGATYTLKIDIETVQYDKYASVWNLPNNTNVAIAETKQRMIKGLKLNNSDANYDNGDKTALFEFEHPATVQTPALTDYRYIGATPNNYVKFNCDNDGTNCEIWRIIGVFSVDDGTGNYEQRIKLVRGSVLPETMAWDDRDTTDEGGYDGVGKNDWNGAKLNIFLNGDYLNRENSALNYGLKENAKTLISDAKYYLGGFGYNSSSSTYGSAADIYKWERGEETFSYETYCLYYNPNGTKCTTENYCERYPNDDICNVTRNIYWSGEVSLLYPSDYGYTYSKGVEQDCFDDLTMCYYNEEYIIGTTHIPGNYNHPELSWIYNSSNLGDQSSSVSNWFVSPSSQYGIYVFNLNDRGTVGSAFSVNDSSLAVRPVVYLKSSIQILSGTGTEQDPYTLSS